MLARAYLYTQKWDSADAEASLVINQSNLYNLDSLNGVFLANSTEAIWQLQPVAPNLNTWEGSDFILVSPPDGNNPVYLSDNLLNSFEAGDARFTNWVGNFTDTSGTYYFPYKYKVKTNASLIEYMMVLRLAELYLIRSEARAMEGNVLGSNGAIGDLDIIRTRAWLANYSGSTDNNSVLSAILHERQVELFTEWGHRWLDLKRTSSVDSVMGRVYPMKINQPGAAWNSNWQLFPIPLGDLLTDPNLVQNPGY